MEKGYFIVIEGIDGAGTTTQTNNLARSLEAGGVDLMTTREPSDGPIGQLIREILHRKIEKVAPPAVALLFAADRVAHLSREIEPALRAGKLVVSDRYYHSSLAYQSQFDDWDWVAAINRHAPAPDLTFIIELEVAEASRRRAERSAEELYDDFEFQKKVAAAYGAMKEKLPGQLIISVDGSLPAAQITALLRAAIHERLKI